MATETILNGWMPEPEFAAKVRAKLGFGSTSTLARWRRLGVVPDGFETRHFGRVPMWREVENETASP
jgi:hypothetical protein